MGKNKDKKVVKPQDSTIADKKTEAKDTIINKNEHLKLVSSQSGYRIQALDNTVEQEAQSKQITKPEDPTIAFKKNQTENTLIFNDEHLKSVLTQAEDKIQALVHNDDMTTPKDLPQDVTMGEITKENRLFSYEEVYEKAYNRKKKFHRSETNPENNGIPGQRKKGEHPNNTLKTRLFTKLKTDWKISSQKYPCYIPKSDRSSSYTDGDDTAKEKATEDTDDTAKEEATEDADVTGQSESPSEKQSPEDTDSKKQIQGDKGDLCNSSTLEKMVSQIKYINILNLITITYLQSKKSSTNEKQYNDWLRSEIQNCGFPKVVVKFQVIFLVVINLS